MIRIRKRNGNLEPLNVDKVHAVVEHMARGLAGVSVSEIEIGAQLQFTDGMTSERIQELVIKSAESLITPENPNYAIAAARGEMYDVRKRAYGNTVPSFHEHVTKMVDIGKYDSMLLDEYDAIELTRMSDAIDHSRDDNFSHAACGQLLDKYLLRDRTKHRAYYETPQMMYMAIAASLLSYLPRHKRVDQIIKFYNAASTFKFSLPTPIMSGARTPTRQFSSCVVIKCGDTLDSINATATAVANYVSKRAGIGISEGAIRAMGQPIRGGEMVHTGILPFLKYHVGALKSCSQGGVRGGNATAYYPFWHLEYETIIVLKNNRGIEENRERRVDYGIEMNAELIRRYLTGEDIYLFSPNEVPEMYDAFYKDQQQFNILYREAIKRAESGEIQFKKMSSTEWMNQMVDSRTETGRYYVAFIDTLNQHTPFDSMIDTIYQSNLCLEIALPTREFQDKDDTDGRIALCTLASFNMAEFLDGNLEDMEETAEVLVQALDGLLSMQDYPMIQAKIATDEFRTLGVGIVNLAEFIMKHGEHYGTDRCLQLVNEWMEKFNYALTKASVKLAETMGPCQEWKRTSYGKGVFPWELHNENIAAKLDKRSYMPEKWDELRSEVLQHGIRNATLSAVAPTESSSQVLNATNGVEMPRSFLSIKSSKSGNFRQFVPSPKDGAKYDYLWHQTSPRPYLTTCAVVQKWVDQAISTNTFYNPEHHGGEISREMVIGDIIYAHWLGLKTLYYSNIADGATDETEISVVDMEKICANCVV